MWAGILEAVNIDFHHLAQTGIRRGRCELVLSLGHLNVGSRSSGSRHHGLPIVSLKPAFGGNNVSLAHVLATSMWAVGALKDANFEYGARRPDFTGASVKLADRRTVQRWTEVVVEWTGVRSYKGTWILSHMPSKRGCNYKDT